MAKRYSAAFNRDWEFYLVNSQKFTFCGSDVPEQNYDPDGVDAKIAFYELDARGVVVPTNQPELLRTVIRCKKSINFNIKQWADGSDVFMRPGEYLDEFVNPPDWVLQALERAILKRRKAR